MEFDPMFDLDEEVNEPQPEDKGWSRRQFIQRSALGAMAAGAAVAGSGLESSAEAAAKNKNRIKVGSRRPNIVIIITDQERKPQHWPENWADEHLPNRKRLADKGLSFNRAFCNTAMCSPSRTTLFTGLYPAQHGVEHTLTTGGSLSQEEPTLQASTQNMARMLASAGYNVQYRGKWHLSKDVTSLTDASSADDLERFGFHGWQPPDAGQDMAPEHFGGGCADYDRRWAKQAADFLSNSKKDLSQPFALIVSFVNPHDALAYPSTWNLQTGNAQQGYCNNYLPDAPGCFEYGIELPPTHDENLIQNHKPTAQAQTLLLTAAGLGPLTPDDKVKYVNFYAHLHKVVDEHIGTVLDALESNKKLHQKTLVFRLSDHGEMGMSHGGMRQKLFNAYEETINVPLVISNPRIFPNPVKTNAMASLVDVMPTLATIAQVPDREQWDFKGRDLTPIILDAINNPSNPTASVQDSILFTYDDDNPGSSSPQNFVRQPNHIRCIRDERYKYTIYFDPCGNADPQSELYDLVNDPLELHNMANPANTAYYDADLVAVMQDKLTAKMAETDTNFTPSSAYCG